MNIKKWIWCLHCERCFEVHLSRQPEWDAQLDTGESPFNFAADFEMQLGVEQGGQVYAECPYDGCDGSLLDFWWWEEYGRRHPEAPETPEADTEYPLYP